RSRPIVIAGLSRQRTGSDLPPRRFPVGSLTRPQIPFPNQCPPSRSRYLNSNSRISAPHNKRTPSPPRPHTLPRRETKRNSNSAHRDAILSLTPLIRIYRRQKGWAYGIVEVAKRRSL